MRIRTEGDLTGYGNYYFCNCQTLNECCTTIVCICNPPSLTDVKSIYFCSRCCMYTNNTPNWICAIYQITCTHDNMCCVLCGLDCAFEAINCYCYICVSDNCWNFYKNGACVCQVTMSEFPKHNISYTYCMSNSAFHQSEFSIISPFITIETKIGTVDVCYLTSVGAVYFESFKCGEGDIVYNVIDSTTGNCISTSLSVNCMHILPCSVACHKYEIVQCNNGPSCVISYAVAATEA